MINSYLQKHAFVDQQILSLPKPGLGLVVVIPCYKEQNIIDSIQSLLECDQVDFNVEILVVVNYSEIENDEIMAFNQNTIQEIESFASKQHNGNVAIHVIKALDLPKKHAGVGLARKIGMDEALRRFVLVGKTDGIICAFDADSTCHKNYLKEVFNFFETHPKKWGCSIYYEHPIEELDVETREYNAIYEYELHLRYHIQSLKQIKYPFSNHTVGSSMAVTAFGYASLGGMNKRKAGEDFYFLHKFSVVYKLGELNTTTLYPSPRSSDRVPFGTGRAVGQLLEMNTTLTTYHPEAFNIIGKWLKDPLQVLNPEYPVPTVLLQFLKTINFYDRIKEIKKNTTSKKAFIQRFYRFFNPFIFMKWLHYFRDHQNANIDVYEASRLLLDSIDIDHKNKDLLSIYRKLDHENN